MRPFSSSDAAEVARLHEIVYPRESGLSSVELQSYFVEIFLKNPWFDEELPSLVHERQGKVVGFIGIIPRIMWTRQRKIRAAVHSQSMVHPAYRTSGVALALLKAVMSGSQELMLTDGANESGRKMWELIGGVSPAIYNLEWLRILRPVAFGLSRLAKNSAFFAGVASFGSRAMHLLDSVMARATVNPLAVPRSDGDEPLGAEELVECIRKFSSKHTLRPEYGHAAMRWLLNIAANKQPPTALRVRCIRRGSEITGWYVYHANPGGISHVLQLGGARQHIDSVLEHLFDDAFQQGSVALVGRMEPNFASELGARGAVFINRATNFICRSRDREVMHAIATGDAFLSRLEGEWWMRFHDCAGQRGAAKAA